MQLLAGARVYLGLNNFDHYPAWPTRFFIHIPELPQSYFEVKTAQAWRRSEAFVAPKLAKCQPWEPYKWSYIRKATQQLHLRPKTY